MGNDSGWNFADCGAWILGVEMTIEVAVEGHGCAAGKHHTGDDHHKAEKQFVAGRQGLIARPKRLVQCNAWCYMPGGQRKTNDRKWHREYGMTELY